jgi:tetratricopeptide (TPR) repeat protein
MLYALALEPAAPQIRLCVPRCHYWAHRFPEALESLEDLLRVQPGDPLVTTWLGRALCATGRYEEALARLEQIPVERRTHWVDGVLATALAGCGRAEEARALSAPRFSSIWCYALLGEHEAALDLLEAAIRARDGYMVFAGVDSAFDLLRDSPRFDAILAQVALPGSQMQVTRSSP